MLAVLDRLCHLRGNIFGGVLLNACNRLKGGRHVCGTRDRNIIYISRQL